MRREDGRDDAPQVNRFPVTDVREDLGSSVSDRSSSLKEGEGRNNQRELESPRNERDEDEGEADERTKAHCSKDFVGTVKMFGADKRDIMV